MCTVTYLPKGEQQFILTSNRDEVITRVRPQFPKLHQLTNHSALFPKDTAGGTWIGISDMRRTACLLNGAFEIHERKLPYRKSRGFIVLDVLTDNNLTDFLTNYDLDNIEPFTLIIIDNFDKLELLELKWDGINRHVRKLNQNKPHIWSSATLYDQDMKKLRVDWFKKWQQSNIFEIDSIRNFHKTAGEGNPITNLITERGFLKTVSITTIESLELETTMFYEDLTLQETSISKIPNLLISSI